MIESVLTIDYEIYGDGHGSLHSQVYEPMQRLMRVLEKMNSTCVVFVEVAELDRIEQEGSDPALNAVKQQVRKLYAMGHEIALHLHPQWYNARYSGGTWHLDYTEYNLCVLGKPRIAEIVGRAIRYLGEILDDREFSPFSFRAGNWLFQPTADAAAVLADHGVQVDSSVFKGGLIHAHHLDYRQASGNGNYWNFSRDVTVKDPEGILLEMPIYTRMVRPWNLMTAKRLSLHRRAGGGGGAGGKRGGSRMSTLRDRLRCRYPVKLDSCRMTGQEQITMLDTIRQQDAKDPDAYRPIVSIGHTKDLEDVAAIETVLNYLAMHDIGTTTLRAASAKCVRHDRPPA